MLEHSPAQFFLSQSLAPEYWLNRCIRKHNLHHSPVLLHFLGPVFRLPDKQNGPISLFLCLSDLLPPLYIGCRSFACPFLLFDPNRELSLKVIGISAFKTSRLFPDEFHPGRRCSKSPIKLIPPTFAKRACFSSNDCFLSPFCSIFAFVFLKPSRNLLIPLILLLNCLKVRGNFFFRSRKI